MLWWRLRRITRSCLRMSLSGVLETHVRAGETVPAHTHRWPAVPYIQSWSDFVRRDGSGAVTVDSRLTAATAAGSAVWSGPLGLHTLENVGGGELRVLSIEIKGDGDRV